MSAITVRLPNSIHQKVKELAVQDEISINQFIASAVAEKVSAFLTVEYLQSEAGLGKREDFAKVRRSVPHASAATGDEI